MTFVCKRCGDCCSTMGEIISIQEQIRPFEFRIAFTNGEERIVLIDPDKRILFNTERERGTRSAGCPFLRQRAEHERICTVYASRPELCRDYRCSCLLPRAEGHGRNPGFRLQKSGSGNGWVL